MPFVSDINVEQYNQLGLIILLVANVYSVVSYNVATLLYDGRCENSPARGEAGAGERN